MSRNSINRSIRYLRRNPSQALRHGVQLFTVLAMLLAAYQFSIYVDAVRSGGPEEYRPPVVEGFLPVAGIVAWRSTTLADEWDTKHPAGFVILMTALATAFFFRRGLCSWICPLGALSEALWRLGAKLKHRVEFLPKWLDWPLLGLRYTLFLFVLNYFFLMPIDAAKAFVKMPYYAVSDIRMFDFFASITLAGVAVIVLLMVLSLFIRAFWCRYLCPYGAVLGVLGLFSPFVLVKDFEKCNECGVCLRGCPSSVQVAKRKLLVLSAECTGCAKCASVCPRPGAIDFRLGAIFKVRPHVFGALFVAAFFGAILYAKATGFWHSSLTFDEVRAFDRAVYKEKSLPR